MYARILQALQGVYGDSKMVEGLADHLDEKIERFEVRDPAYYGDNQLNDMIRETCWNWFSGGGTAQIAADRVEGVINA